MILPPLIIEKINTLFDLSTSLNKNSIDKEGPNSDSSILFDSQFSGHSQLVAEAQEGKILEKIISIERDIIEYISEEVVVLPAV